MKKLRLLFLCSILQFSCTAQTEKVNGVSFVASRDKAEQIHVDPVVRVNANYAAVMPFGFMRGLDSPNVIFNTDRQWFGETRDGAKQYIGVLQANAMKVMLKPQLYTWRGFTGHIKMNTEEDWLKLEESYSDFILTYAHLAEETQVQMLCIGTELEGFIVERPQYWEALIKRIRKVYKGKLTYAANWDEYPRVPFWQSLDYIGVDAYFPLSDERYPSLGQLKEGWQRWKTDLNQLAEAKNKPVLFTEFGYRSIDYTGKKPWVADRNEGNVNLEAQANATRAIFEEFWKEDWFAGGFIWKWFIHYDRSGGTNDNRFTPQNKPAEEVIKEFYKTAI